MTTDRKLPEEDVFFGILDFACQSQPVETFVLKIFYSVAHPRTLGQVALVAPYCAIP